jgi:lysozyme family protein
MSSFDRMFDVVIGNEGGFTSDPQDPGNWTGGAVGAGRCHGTKFGISAAAYPDVDIANLTLDLAGSIYQRDYWQRIAGDRLPAALALLVFDAAVNSGVGRAARWLQQAAQVPQDGMIGPRTLAAINRVAEQPEGVANLCAEFLAQRLWFMTSLPTWKTFGLGWARRLCRLPYDLMQDDGPGIAQ